VIVAVIGKGRNCPADVSDTAYGCGVQVAALGHVLVTGGLGGCMLGAAHGAASRGGTVLGIVPANRDPDPTFPGIVIRTGLSEATRNVVIGSCADAVIACAGSHGTMQELAVALDRGVPCVQVRTQAWSAFVGRAVDVLEVDEWLTSIDPAGKS
jgi:uncharacterized protein (TIGR00725 family)